MPNFLIGTLRNENGRNNEGSCENINSTLHEILEQKKVKGSASEANKDCQILLFDIQVDQRTLKVILPRSVGEDDVKQVVSSVHSSVQFMYSAINTAFVLCRSLLQSPLPSSYLKVPIFYVAERGRKKNGRQNSSQYSSIKIERNTTIYSRQEKYIYFIVFNLLGILEIICQKRK